MLAPGLAGGGGLGFGILILVGLEPGAGGLGSGNGNAVGEGVAAGDAVGLAIGPGNGDEPGNGSLEGGVCANAATLTKEIAANATSAEGIAERGLVTGKERDMFCLDLPLREGEPSSQKRAKKPRPDESSRSPTSV